MRGLTVSEFYGHIHNFPWCTLVDSPVNASMLWTSLYFSFLNTKSPYSAYRFSSLHTIFLSTHVCTGQLHASWPIADFFFISVNDWELFLLSFEGNWFRYWISLCRSYRFSRRVEVSSRVWDNPLFDKHIWDIHKNLKWNVQTQIKNSNSRWVLGLIWC